MHDIDFTKNKAAIAYAGLEPWHSLGYKMEEGLPPKEWAAPAGLDYEVFSAPVSFKDAAGNSHEYPSRRVLYRSDNSHPFGVVSDRYKVVQPIEVLDFFTKLCANHGFTMETAGALSKGGRVWALAKAGQGEAVVGQDEVRPYILLATSYDGTMATVAKPTAIRVVCRNTLAMSIGRDGKGGEADATGTERPGRVIVPHFRTFNADEVHLELGLIQDQFHTFMAAARKLAKRKVNTTFATEFLKMLLPPAVSVETVNGAKIVKPKPVEETRGFQQIMALFQGEALGASLTEANGTAWGLLNAVTQHVDWQRGRNDDSRMTSAWFGAGEALKNRALGILLEVA
jgi:phage/plasmid-like protein (TIGR03299 family)